jgi:hypothetical protein
LKGVGKIFSKIFLTGVWGRGHRLCAEPQVIKRQKLRRFNSWLKREIETEKSLILIYQAFLF